ncbi:MAG: tRNA lysidine(34) synthetase TilS [Flavobacteriaceae bacterium]|nr:tRNA lysidine(34) synthetase TilS [Flavobacteriaceae bacterium]
MLQKFNHHIDDKFPFLKEKKILIACSGGLDSVVLTRLLRNLKFNISLAHCNFSLRGVESDGDEEFVEKLADKLSVPIFTKTFDTKTYANDHKISTQMAARDLRYEWFDELINNFNFDYLLTAHHLDDDLETFLINLSRGTGLRGLTGIPENNEKIIRPLLNFTRQDLLIYAQKETINWREDSSNSKADYLRNKLRLEVIPKLKETDVSLLKSFQQTQKHLKESLLLVEDYMVLIQNLVFTETANGLKIDIYKLQELPNTKALLYELLSPYGFTAWEDISDLLNAQSGKQIFSNTHRLIKDRSDFLLTETDSNLDSESIFISEELETIETPFKLQFDRISEVNNPSNKEVYVDFEKLKFPLEIRTWKEGDYFYPFGMKGKKKLSKFFKDEKLSLVAKEKVRVLCTENVIVWVMGMRLDDRFKVTENTKKTVKITYN